MAEVLPTVYEYYTAGGINAGLSADQPYFTLNNKNISIYSGAMHYFRVPKPYWRDRLRKLRHAGLNTVETYIAWNLHEPQQGWYDFGHGGSDFQDFLDVQEFLVTAQEEDLLAIVRPGPYICAEWEFGGLPSWLLRESDIKLRTSDEKFMNHVRKFFNVLLSLLTMLQFTKGGPIIAFQVENEYGSTLHRGFIPDKNYLLQLKQIFRKNGIVELLFTSDNVAYRGTNGSIPEEFLLTTNFGNDAASQLSVLDKYQLNKPKMVGEFWIGWYNHWFDMSKRAVPPDVIRTNLREILTLNASVNFYMFHGGTTFGFMNGANYVYDENHYLPDLTSYDYDAPLTERGEYTLKYLVIKNLLLRYTPVKFKMNVTGPDIKPAVSYGERIIEQEVSLYDVINDATFFTSVTPIPMEYLPINNMSGQSYGYLVYRKEHLSLPAFSELLIEGRVQDTVMVLINGNLVSKPLESSEDLDGFGYWRFKNSNLTLTEEDMDDATLDLVVENWGRVNFAYSFAMKQYKGLWQDIHVNGKKIYNWKMIPLEFRTSWTNNLKLWKPYNPSRAQPRLYKTTLEVYNIEDTYIDMRRWTKGIVIVNGFVLGRYARVGPQQTLYLPAPLLRKGNNDIIIFEHFTGTDYLTFSRDPIYGSQLEIEAFLRNSRKIHRSSSASRYWALGIWIFVINNVAMVTLYFMFKMRR